MEPKSEGSLTSVSGDESSQSASDSGKCSGRKCKRREKNRVAAQNSRRKQTKRADLLHQELQLLESSNVAYEKEIAVLRLEVQHYSSALQLHEPHCCMLDFSRTEMSQSAPSPVPTPAAADPTDLSLSELLGCAEWPPCWDSLW